MENGNGGVAALNLEKYDEHVRELIHTIETKGAERESAVSECEELFEIPQRIYPKKNWLSKIMRRHSDILILPNI